MVAFPVRGHWLGLALAVLASGGAAAAERWEAALERSAVVFDRPNGGPCERPVTLWGGKVVPRKFTTGRPAYVMPVGAGNLSAMVSFGEDRWELHLSQADYLVTTNGTTSRVKDVRGLELRSPGHVTVAFDGLTTNAITCFEQKMDMLRGRVTLKIETARGAISAEVFGDRKTGALVVLADDTRKGVAAPAVTQQMKPLRPPVEVRTEGGRIKVAIGITAEATKAALAADTAAQRAATERWWRDYWARGWIDLTGDKRAERLERLWYSNLYVWGSVGYGPMPPKFNGGPGIVFDDTRCWGRNVWWQNTREMIWPMAGANRGELAKSYLDLYGDCHANFAGNDNTNAPPKTGDMKMAEVINLFKSPLFTDRNCPARPVDAPYVELTDAERRAAREQRKSEKGTHTRHVHSSATELLMQMVDYVRFTGDRTMLRHVATYLRSQTELYLKLLERGEDGKWHVRCSNVNESWVKADDGIVDLASARWLMAMTAAHGKEFGFPENLIADAKARLGKIADYPTGPVYENFHSKTGLNFRASSPTVYHPCILTNGMKKANFENNELYLVHPYAMAGVDEEGPRRQLAIDTYLNGINVNGGGGWTPVAVAVARMRLPQAATIVFNHSKSCGWPFGGANSPGSSLHNKSPYNDTCYMDTTGVMQTGVQELLLQSHAEEPDPSFFTGGPVRLAPCVPETWSGAFKLRARGGFVVEAAFEKGKVVSAKATSEFGNDFTWIDPATGARKTRKTKPGETFAIVD